MKFSRSLILYGAAVSAAVLLSACQPAEPPQQQGHAMAPPAVDVATVLSEPVTEWDEFTGRLEATQTVELRPRVSGYIDKVTFEEGAQVNKGDLLFEIDPRSFQAEVNRLNAELASAEARLDLAERDMKRAQSLKKQNAISVEQVDSRESQLSQARAQVQSTRAALESAKLSLSFTKVTAPIAGRVSRAVITEGNYVQAGQSLLTTLVSTDKVYAYFDADERTYLKYRDQVARGDRPSARDGDNPALMSLADEQDYAHTGYIDFLDNRVNPETGTIRGRAVFDNQNDEFTPGLFARVRIIASGRHEGILINDRAINTDLSNKFVLVLGEDNKVTYRPVELGPKVDGLRLIRKGLQSGEKIVVNGLQRVRPGAEVTPQETAMAEPAALERFYAQQRIVEKYLTEQARLEAAQAAAPAKASPNAALEQPRG
ncbi:efflux RND transporter periplasmic adaptor subunit [Hahella sp. KA22]|uniref:efflux RND transporter periplasmic adaptor subunit n=1 Tax=Hahella sp. KA22 TaxID=1628392 RepID=UPI000FDEB81A|nr:efflux RND transporter periplasmic adaptor subunit [Hahella sp. KA22]AZZ95248.1 efflux RND transporter periplasmic adaptor subunit [Hahella sp. KA22]QAY52893.1 efflux RND transporter periplasmic adaptor subunit [Hahella sp. KA22]